MKPSDLLNETYLTIISNKARSGLTILGIVIGIGSVIAMISIGQGAKNTIESNIQALGSNLILVMPGAQRGAGIQINQGRGSAQTLTNKDAEIISQQINEIQGIAPELSGRYQITAKGTNTNTSITGTTSDYPAVRNIEIAEGSFISNQNVKSLSKVAGLGSTARDDLFGENSNPIGQTIRIKKINFKVIGITKSKGGSGFSNQDDMIFIPITTAQQFLAGSDRVSTISVQVASENLMADVQEQINKTLLLKHNF